MAEQVVHLVGTEVDVAARQLHQSGVAVTAVASTLGSCGFSASGSGRGYSAQGSAVHGGLQVLAKAVVAWSSADDHTGGALTAAVVALVRTDRTHRSDVHGVG